MAQDKTDALVELHHEGHSRITISKLLKNHKMKVRSLRSPRRNQVWMLIMSEHLENNLVTAINNLTKVVNGRGRKSC